MSILFKKTIFTLLILLLCSIGILLLTLQQPNPATKKIQNSKMPDAFMEHITATIFDQNGQPKLQISSPKLAHFKNNDVSQLEQPKIILFRKNATPWTITAAKAKTANGIKTIKLSNDVLAYQEENSESPATTFKTETLTLHAEQKTADTKLPVVLIQPNITIRGIGLHANLKTGAIELLSQLRGEYDP